MSGTAVIDTGTQIGQVEEQDDASRSWAGKRTESLCSSASVHDTDDGYSHTWGLNCDDVHLEICPRPILLVTVSGKAI